MKSTTDTLKATGLKTKREVVEMALKELLRLERQGDFKKLKGQIDWQGDLEDRGWTNDTYRFECLDRLFSWCRFASKLDVNKSALFRRLFVVGS